MERYQVILAYDGSHFKGYQRQANAHSIQGVVESALCRLGWQGQSILAAGRTDTGAHASGQVIAFDLDWTHSPQELQQALNSLLPTDVVAREVRQAPSSFHPRFDASWRRYHYRIYCQPVRQPLLDPYAWHVWPAADFGLLQQAASLIVGVHDFGAFGTPPLAEGITIRQVLGSGWKEESPYLIYEIVANAFLYHMVRRLVFMQVSIAQGKLEMTNLKNALVSGSPNEMQSEPGKRLVHGLAPARGLILAEVGYPPGVLCEDEDTQKTEKSIRVGSGPIGPDEIV